MDKYIFTDLYEKKPEGSVTAFLIYLLFAGRTFLPRRKDGFDQKRQAEMSQQKLKAKANPGKKGMT